jgi:hypothetical protein
MTTARIYGPAKNAMRSIAQTKSWVLNFEQASPKAVKPADSGSLKCAGLFLLQRHRHETVMGAGSWSQVWEQGFQSPTLHLRG